MLFALRYLRLLLANVLQSDSAANQSHWPQWPNCSFTGSLKNWGNSASSCRESECLGVCRYSTDRLVPLKIWRISQLACFCFFLARIVVWDKSNRSGETFQLALGSAWSAAACGGWWGIFLIDGNITAEAQTPYSASSWLHISFDKTLHSSLHLDSLPVLYFSSPKKNKRTKSRKTSPPPVG